MKLAIQARENGFSGDWIQYCKENHVSYKLVDCYANDIIDQVSDCDILMWHWNQVDFAASLFARQLTHCLESNGKKVFPDSNTCRFYDDKIGQKYLLESSGIRHIPTHIFYSELSALDWIKSTTFPKVFKLSKGAGSSNVILAKTSAEARKLVKKAFGRGFKTTSYITLSGKKKVIGARSYDEFMFNLKKVPGYIRKTIVRNKLFGAQRGYAYFQDFIPNKDHDIRVVVIGKKSFVKTRFCPPGDFRASGAKIEDFDHKKIDIECVKIAFEISRKLHFQSMAYDFIYINNQPVLIEVSYAFATPIYPGYYDSDLQWHDGEIQVYKEMIRNIILQFQG